MKVRNGFVSNSSSSSFILYGFEVSSQELAEMYTDLGIEVDLDVIANLRGDINVSYWKLPHINGLDVIPTDGWYNPEYLIGIKRDPDDLNAPSARHGWINDTDAERVADVAGNKKYSITVYTGEYDH